MSREALGVWGARLKTIWSKYKFVLLVILAGIVLLAIPSFGDQVQETTPAAVETVDDFSVETMESRLAEALSQIEGAGEVRVVLTVKSGARRILAQDGKTTQKDGQVDSTISTVIISNGDRSEETVALQQLSPQYQGALVVCSGGDDPAVRLCLSDAVSALTGLGADKISICKGK
ncbi:stage III sporulation protein AG [Lawsonibacter celer]|uniref:stage III sporulation protein AG n=1 Tax=Lawsonibacter celer TaxID=2986526 RepID=UPI001646D3D4|nr:stage III sporulation protein AG [Lawsonibacter celer]